MTDGKPWDDTESGRDAGVAAAFGDELRSRRKAAGLTQAVVAERAGVHAVTVSLLERGKRQPSLGVVLRLADALGDDVLDVVAEVRVRLGQGQSAASAAEGDEKRA